MISLILILCSPLLTCATASQSPPALEDVYQSQQVQQPDDDQYTQPSIQIKYTGINGVKYVNQGNQLFALEVSTKPNITLLGVKNDILYTLLMLDLDAPSRSNPSLSPLCHYIVGNIPNSNVEEGDIVFDYLPPTPPPLLGPHRYTFCVYPQKSQIEFQESFTSDPVVTFAQRLNFNVQNFRQKYSLGRCEAINYFLGFSK